MYKCNKCGQVVDYLPMKGDSEEGRYLDISHHGCGGVFRDAEECCLCGHVVMSEDIIRNGVSSHVCTWCVDSAMSDKDTARECIKWALDNYPRQITTYFHPDLLENGELTYFAAEYLRFKEATR